MKLALISAVMLGSLLTASAAEKDTRIFELRTYHAAPGKLDALNARFREHTTPLFEKHGLHNVGYWVPVENADNLLIYVVSYPSAEAGKKAWKEFGADPAWQEARKASEVGGKLVVKVDRVFLSATDFSPQVTPAATGERLFELRTYTTPPGKLPNLLARFREHTLGLFEKAGMTNLSYWQPLPDQPAADTTLIYLLAHRDAAAAAKSWAEFRANPVWIAAKKASEDQGGGSLTTPDGVKSLMLKPTDYSPLR